MGLIVAGSVKAAALLFALRRDVPRSVKAAARNVVSMVLIAICSALEVATSNAKGRTVRAVAPQEAVPCNARILPCVPRTAKLGAAWFAIPVQRAP